MHTSVWKDPVQGRRLVRRLNVDGDAQGDLAGHGGEHRAFGHQIDSYLPTSTGNVNSAVRILRPGNSAKQQHLTELGHYNEENQQQHHEYADHQIVVIVAIDFDDGRVAGH